MPGWPTGVPGRGVQLVAGLLVASVGIWLTIRAGLGVASWEVLHIALAQRLGIGIGTASMLVGACLVLLVSVLGVRPGRRDGAQRAGHRPRAERCSWPPPCWPRSPRKASPSVWSCSWPGSRSSRSGARSMWVLTWALGRVTGSCWPCTCGFRSEWEPRGWSLRARVSASGGCSAGRPGSAPCSSSSSPGRRWPWRSGAFGCVRCRDRATAPAELAATISRAALTRAGTARSAACRSDVITTIAASRPQPGRGAAAPCAPGLSSPWVVT